MKPYPYLFAEKRHRLIVRVSRGIPFAERGRFNHWNCDMPATGKRIETAGCKVTDA